jgi:hypothetical protein
MRSLAEEPGLRAHCQIVQSSRNIGQRTAHELEPDSRMLEIGSETTCDLSNGNSPEPWPDTRSRSARMLPAYVSIQLSSSAAPCHTPHQANILPQTPFPIGSTRANAGTTLSYRSREILVEVCYSSSPYFDLEFYTELVQFGWISTTSRLFGAPEVRDSGL